MVMNPLDVIAAQASGRPSLTADPEGGALTQDNAAAKAYYDEISALPGTPGYERKQAELRRQAVMNGGSEEINSQKRDEVLAQQNGLVLPENYSATTAPEPVLLSVTPAAPTHRLGIYYGRDPDTYNVIVETAPDWENAKVFKSKSKDETELMIELTRAVGIRVADKTGEFSG